MSHHWMLWRNSYGYSCTIIWILLTPPRSELHRWKEHRVSKLSRNWADKENRPSSYQYTEVLITKYFLLIHCCQEWQDETRFSAFLRGEYGYDWLRTKKSGKWEKKLWEIFYSVQRPGAHKLPFSTFRGSGKGTDLVRLSYLTWCFHSLTNKKKRLKENIPVKIMPRNSPRNRKKKTKKHC